MLFLCIFVICGGDGTLKLSPELLSRIRGHFLRGIVPSDTDPIPAENGGHFFFCTVAGLLKQVCETADATCVCVILRHYSHGNPEISESHRNTSENNNKTGPRKSCQSQHFANTAVVSSAQPKYCCLSVDSQPRKILEIWASGSKGWCRHQADDRAAWRSRRQQQVLNE